MKFNIITVIGVIFALSLLTITIWACLTNKNKIFETFQNIGNYNTYDPYGPLKNNIGGTVPLPENELDFFYNNRFDPSCCSQPQHYSSSTGCACITPEQMRYLNTRGGNHTSCNEI